MVNCSQIIESRRMQLSHKVMKATEITEDSLLCFVSLSLAQFVSQLHGDCHKKPAEYV